ncbi:alpha/beta hydrolase [Salipiger thiooxidans]|uniref:alpha/beta hydrolase n=1 Tax=Salipiger thiooxidans TaxID=282683 RepID=UPI001CD4289D|nr:alpha/beta hydrolase [Salipiger thiooxidans]MCA0848258.1 alpha/beta hydrolase [Salipiger thiooxidans]
MTPEQIIAAVALLTSAPALDTQSGGGFHTRDPAPREGFHEPMRSDVRVPVAGGTNDPQPSWTWSLLAAETLENSRVVIFPNAGHGTSLYSDCGKDMNVTFILDPGAELDTACVGALTPCFVLPDTPLP